MGELLTQTEYNCGDGAEIVIVLPDRLMVVPFAPANVTAPVAPLTLVVLAEIESPFPAEVIDTFDPAVSVTAPV